MTRSKAVAEIRKDDQFIPDDDGFVYWTARTDAEVEKEIADMRQRYKILKSLQTAKT